MSKKEDKNKSVSDLDTGNNTTDANLQVNAQNSAGIVAPTGAARNATNKYSGVNSFVYVGPSLPAGRLKNGTVLNGTYAEITDYYKEAIALYPGVERLIVPVSQLGKAQGNLKVSDNALYNLYCKVVAEIQSKGDEQ